MSAAEVWENKYLNIRDVHEELKKQSNEQQQVIKQMYTKLKMIDGAMDKQDPAPRQPNKETASLVESLKKENQHLKKVNLDLREKLRNGGKPNTMKRPGSATRTPTSSDVVGLKKRLGETEDRLKSLNQQNSELRHRLERSSKNTENDMFNNLNVKSNLGTDLISNQRDLKDKDAQIALVKARYDQLEAKARAAAEIHERTVFMMEEGNRTIRDLRRRVQALQHENENLGVYQQQAGELELELASSREEASKLEHRMTQLCESPFINDAYESRSRVDKLVSLERSDRQNRVQIEHLKETAKTHHAEILALKSSSEQICKQRDDLIKENHSLKLQVDQLSRGAGLLEDKMKLYSSEAGVDASELEQALTMIRRNSDAMGTVGFLEGGGSRNQPEALMIKHKLQELQVSHLNACRELEMSERMLKAQTAINKDINAEVEDLHQRLKGSNNELHRKLDDYESLCAKRLQKIHSLEAQVKQLMQKQRKMVKKSESDDDEASVGNISVVSLAASDADFGPGENLVEVWVVGASFNENKVEPGVTSFVMMDFYDYETQTSPLLTGLAPRYDFAATYKVNADHFFMRYLSNESLTLEVNRMLHGDYALLGLSSISLRPLVEGNGKLKLSEVEIISARDGSVVGHLELCIRLALPVKELFQVYLQEVPGEKERFERIKQAEEENREAVLAKARAQNQLEVTVLAAKGLGSGNTRPSAFVHFQLLSFPDTFTTIVNKNGEPEFDQCFPFPLLVDNKLIRFLEREKLEINVLDDSSDDSDSLLGKVVIPLHDIARGSAIDGTFDLRDADGVHAGTIKIRIAWRSPLLSLERVGAIPGQDNADLTEVQLREFVKQFESSNHGDIDWKSFLALNGRDSNERLKAVQQRLRLILGRALEKGVALESGFSHFDRNGEGSISKPDFEMALEEMKIQVNDSDLQVMIGHLIHNGKISYNEFLAVSAPPSEQCLVAEKKIRLVLADLLSKGNDVRKTFKRREVNGQVSFMDFCKCFRDMGFHVEIEKVTPEKKVEKRSQVDVKEEEEILDTKNEDEKEDLFGRKKREFNERMHRAAHASNTVDNEADRNFALAQYGIHADRSAERLQAQFRGHLSRQSKFASNVSDVYGLVVEAEDSIRSSLAKLEKDTKYDLRTYFTKRDNKRRGYISVSLFTRALTDAKLGISSNHALALASYFQSEESLVDYNEFVRFASYRPVDVSGITPHLRNILLEVNDDKMFRSSDGDNSGFLRKREFIKCLKGIRSLSSFDMKAIADVFEMEGDVNYLDFVQFAQSQPLTLTLKEIVDKLKAMTKSAGDKVGADLSIPFKHLDRDGDGCVTRVEFKQGLRELGFDLTAKETGALYARFDPSNKGKISYQEFVSFISRDNVSMYSLPTPNLSKAQKRLENIVRNASGGALAGGFAHYDWTRTGRIPTQMFHRACSMVGLVVSQPERELIRIQFQNADGAMNYQKFMEWITPKIASADEVVAKLKLMSVAGGQRSFVSTFEKFDVEKQGEISKKEFSQGLKEIGITLDREESISLMKMFDQNGDGYIRYSDFISVLFDSKSGIDRIEGKPVIDRIPGNSAMNQIDEVHNTGASVEKIRAVMESKDKHFSGRISIEDFDAAISVLGLEKPDMQRYLDSDSVVYRKYLQEQEGNQEFVDIVAARLTSMIRTRAEEAGGDLKVPFEHFKADKEGFIDYDSFRSGLDSLEFDLTPQEIAAILEKFDYNGDGKVSFQEFVLRVGGSEEPSSVLISESDAKRLSTVLHLCRRRGANLSGLFEFYDRGAKGAITSDDFAAALNTVCPEIPIDVLSSLGGVLDFESDNRVEYALFSAVGEKGYPGNIPVVRAGTILRFMIKEQEVLQKSLAVPFTHFDRKRRGTFELTQFDRAVHDLAIQISKPELESLFKGINLSHTGKVSFGEFSVFVKDPDYVLQLERMIRKLIMAKVLLDDWDDASIHKSLRAASEDDQLDRHSLRAAMKKVGLELSRDDVERIVRRYDDVGKGSFDLTQFGHFLDSCSKWGRQAAKLSAKINNKELLKQALGSTGLVRNKDVVLSIIQVLGTSSIKETDIYKLVECFDFDGSGRVDVEELLRYLGSNPESNSRRVEHVEEEDDSESILSSIKKVVQRARDEGVDYRKSFEHFDKDYSGEISAEEFEIGMRELGFSLSPSKLKKVFSKFSGSKKHSIKYRQFLRTLIPADDLYIEEVAEKLLKLIQARVRHHGSDGLKKTFRHFQVDSRNRISRAAFSEGLASLNLELNDSDVRQLIDKFDRDADGKISFDEFKAFAEGKQLSARYKGVEAEADTIFDELKALVRLAHNKGVNYKRSFEHFDPSHGGSIDIRDFKTGLEKLGFSVESSHIRILQERFAGNDGRIRYKDFLRAVAPSEDIDANDAVQKLRTMLGKVGDLKQAFKHFERNANGTISKSGLKDGLKSLNMRLDKSELQVVMDVMDSNGDNEISFDEFVDFVAGDYKSKRERFLDSDSSEDDADTRNTVTVSLKKMKLARLSSSVERIYFQFTIPGQDMVRSPAFPISDSNKKQTLSLDYSKSLAFEPKTKQRKDLKECIRRDKCKIVFELVGVKGSGRTVNLGQAEVDLQDILEEMRDMSSEELSLKDDRDQTVARVKIDVKALDVLQAL